ncbi:hypothetical protein RchiOBHm_Chr3g0474951 [Rosa chinensis]|uniref:Uncharacterized protein n=1 Tax=Rosa chinensis TaxID=74649 RepID=A0A2P6RC84_ROSCH|nr:hypothetical protein RchiOBHm_Chr3g0474951 [Rosa chinensis]
MIQQREMIHLQSYMVQLLSTIITVGRPSVSILMINQILTTSEDGIGRILIAQIWFGGDEGSALDPSFEGGDSDRRGGQIVTFGGGDAWWCSDEGSAVFYGGGSLFRVDLYPMRSSGSTVAVAIVGGLERKTGFQPSPKGGDGFWVGLDPLGDEGSDLQRVKDGDMARSAFVGGWGGNRLGHDGLVGAMWRSFATARQLGGGGGVPLVLLGVAFVIAMWTEALWAVACWWAWAFIILDGMEGDLSSSSPSF